MLPPRMGRENLPAGEEGDRLWIAYLRAYEILRRWIVVSATGWTLEEMENQYRTEVDEILLARSMSKGVELSRQQSAHARILKGSTTGS